MPHLIDIFYDVQMEGITMEMGEDKGLRTGIYTPLITNVLASDNGAWSSHVDFPHDLEEVRRVFHKIGYLNQLAFVLMKNTKQEFKDKLRSAVGDNKWRRTTVAVFAKWSWGDREKGSSLFSHIWLTCKIDNVIPIADGMAIVNASLFEGGYFEQRDEPRSGN